MGDDLKLVFEWCVFFYMFYMYSELLVIYVVVELLMKLCVL